MEIHVYLTGRLGNQLFQYAFARELQKKYGGQIFCNVYDLEHFSEKMKHVPGKFHYEMENYLLNNNVVLEDRKLPWYADINCIFIKGLKRLCPKLYFKVMAKLGYLIWQRDEYIEIPELKTNSVTLCGWWQDFRFISNVQNELSSDISPITEPKEENRYIYEAAEESESVCISLRGGNYLDPKVKKHLFVCDREYFYEAIDRLNEKLKNPVYLIFSDDLEWVKNYIRLEEKYPNCRFIYERGSDTVEEKIRMMAMCKHFIISNSSFSWWAQYLSTNADKIVIAPNAWFTNGNRNGLYMDSWECINVIKE
ncbi:alpha-1,2-fucosyltransferase [Enterococcus faecium]|uniref:alpha-1,2-fucosyltransferase n=1 Tax=Enterococcus faecium TaxID=1352 RepID=UPI00296AC4B5|nr:alpha-1,2-fucosyltransferase [Enterococcus faecium]MDW3709242.1 alpha-1,2-fucosyltransferase [Enterococcus faecium]